MKKHPLIKRLSLAAASALALLAGTTPPAQGAAFDSPVGQWDFTLSGKARGNAQIVFNADGTIDGYVQRYTNKKLPKTNPRGPSDDGTRNVLSTNTVSITNLSGDATIDGHWGFDERGKILGYLNEHSFEGTNATTDSITFNGVVTAPTRVTLQGRSSVGKITYSGIPDGPLLNIGAVFTATGKRGKTQVVEFFTLTSMGGNNSIYGVTQGSSPGQTYGGVALLSGRKQLSMVTTNNDGLTPLRLTTLVGSIKTNTAKASLTGKESVAGSVSLKIFPSP